MREDVRRAILLWTGWMQRRQRVGDASPAKCLHGSIPQGQTPPCTPIPGLVSPLTIVLPPLSPKKAAPDLLLSFGERSGVITVCDNCLQLLPAALLLLPCVIPSAQDIVKQMRVVCMPKQKARM